MILELLCTACLSAQVAQESAWNPVARSHAGAVGLMQIMPATAKWLIDAKIVRPGNLYDPMWNLEAGKAYMVWLIKRQPAALNDCEKYASALQSYNGGLGWMQKRWKAQGNNTYWQGSRIKNPGITVANQKENQEYAVRILISHQRKYQQTLPPPYLCVGLASTPTWGVYSLDGSVVR